jgi:integrase
MNINISMTNTSNANNLKLAEITPLYPIQVQVKDNKNKNKVNKNNTNKNTTVQPIKNQSDIERARHYFHDNIKRYSNIHLRNYCLFVLGINVARRIGDLLKLTVGDIIDTTSGVGAFKEWIEIREEKTNKIATFQIHPYVREAISEYLLSLDTYNQYDFLFKSREGQNKPITRNMAWKIMSDMSTDLNLGVNVGTHTLRKTWAYTKIQQNIDNPYIVAEISNELNHKDIKTTFKYCGYDKEERSHIYMDQAVW